MEKFLVNLRRFIIVVQWINQWSIGYRSNHKWTVRISNKKTTKFIENHWEKKLGNKYTKSILTTTMFFSAHFGS